MGYTNQDLLQMENPQFCFVYNELRKDMHYHEMLKDSQCYGVCHTKSSVYQMQTMGETLPVVLFGGDCSIVGEVYKVKTKAFKSLIGFHYGHTPLKIKVTGFKKRVWIWVLPPDNKFILKTLDKPANMVYNWGSIVVGATTPAIITPTITPTILNKEVKGKKHMPLSTPTIRPEKVTVPIYYDPIQANKKETEMVNKDTIAYKLLTEFDTLEDTIWDADITNTERGERCTKALAALREVTKELSKVF